MDEPGGEETEIRPAAGASSAEERCPICLEDYKDKAFIDACFHAFCFGCVVKAVEVTSGRCPMCKTTFDTVIHNVRAIDDYDRVSVCKYHTYKSLFVSLFIYSSSFLCVV